ncbi:DUF6428 family protein [Sphingobacterium sp. 1.A.4]|uniref:DUF6428 family protein n=1 Tax=Sphingobacterium sp. 1.A.4 TaxID=2044603 RepID=UPI000C0BF2B4|nr:DUF6428 family protein [Sphingobacterium sp. 1.A.4]
MKLSAIKEILPTLSEVSFQLEDGSFVPTHFHVTEVGQVNKNYIDCGGKIRHDKTVSFQLWHANDVDHRLFPEKLLNIIVLSEIKLGIEDAEVEVEFQQQTIGKFDLDFNVQHFLLKNKNTACLAEDACGIPTEKPKIKFIELNQHSNNSCSPGSGCC